jgi:hypothetical protein
MGEAARRQDEGVDQMTCETVANIAGLIMNSGGVILLFFFGMPYRVRTGGANSYVTETTDQAEVRAERRYDKIGWVGLALILLGTAAQIGAIVF